jgi:DNA-binding NarL/FixJ family response regulator
MGALSHTEKVMSAFASEKPPGEEPAAGDPAVRPLDEARAYSASEIGAAIAHELNGPLTALILYIGYIEQNSHRFAGTDVDAERLKRVVESAVQEAEQLCSLVHRMGDAFEAPIRKETAVAEARDAIAWWSKASDPEGKSRSEATSHAVDDSHRPALESLTRREREVLRLVSEGYSNKEGAALMNISYRTFECHRAEVMRKLGARNTAELVRFALLGTIGSAPPPGPSGT